MKSLLRGFLLTACAATGIAVAVMVGSAPQKADLHRHSAHRSPGLAMAAVLRPAPAVEAPAEETATTMRVPLEPRLAHEPGAGTAPTSALPDARLPLTQAVPSPIYGQQAAPPTSTDPLKLDINQIQQAEEAARTQQNQQLQKIMQIPMVKEALQGMGGGAATNLPPPTAAGGPAVGAGDPSSEPDDPFSPAAPKPEESKPTPEEVSSQPFKIEPGPDSPDGEQTFCFNFPNNDIHQVLELLAAQGNMNILPTRNVTGDISVVLNDVTIDSALDAICRTNGLSVRRQGKFVYVGTGEDFAQINQSLERVGTRVFRPNYVSALDLQQLLTPLLSPTIGKISVTTAPQVGIASDGDDVGGNSLALGDAVVVQDYESALSQMEQIILEVNVRPLQVAIEAMILSVKLNDKNAFGINWNFLLSNQHVRLATGSVPDTIGAGSAVPSVDKSFSGDGFSTGGGAGNIFLPNGGLAFAFLDQNLGSFVTALETIGDTDVIASPRLMCLNKQRAEILIGAKLGYVSTTVTETSTAQTVEFLEVGAQLRIRPFISTDGTIRMEVHPELSTGAVRIEEGFTLPDKEVTQVTTNIMVRDGCTVVIGGLMREDLTVNTTQVPFLGSLPAVGVLFRQREEAIERREILVLVTPHIAYDPELAIEGAKGASEFHRRQRSALDAGNPLGRDYLGRKYLRLAQEALAGGDLTRAARLVNLATRFDPNNRAAIDLQNDLAAGKTDGEHHGAARMLYDPELIEGGQVPQGGQAEASDEVEVIGPGAVDASQIDPRVLQQLEGGRLQAPVHPRDPGEPGGVRDIEPGPRVFE